MDEEDNFKFKDSSFPQKSRDLILHEGDLDLSCYSWQFGRTPSHSDTQLNLEWDIEDPKEDAAEEATAKRPDIAGHPKNNNNNKNKMITMTLQDIQITRNTKYPEVAKCPIHFC